MLTSSLLAADAVWYAPTMSESLSPRVRAQRTMVDIVALLAVTAVGFGAGWSVAPGVPTASRASASTANQIVPSSNPTYDSCLIGATRTFELNLSNIRVNLVAPFGYNCLVSDGGVSGASAIALQASRGSSADPGYIAIEVTSCRDCIYEAMCSFSSYWKAHSAVARLLPCDMARPPGERVTYLKGDRHGRRLIVLIQDPAHTSIQYPPWYITAPYRTDTVLAIGDSGTLFSFGCSTKVVVATVCAEDANAFALAMAAQLNI